MQAEDILWRHAWTLQYGTKETFIQVRTTCEDWLAFVNAFVNMAVPQFGEHVKAARQYSDQKA